MTTFIPYIPPQPRIPASKATPIRSSATRGPPTTSIPDERGWQHIDTIMAQGTVETLDLTGSGREDHVQQRWGAGDNSTKVHSKYRYAVVVMVIASIGYRVSRQHPYDRCRR
jgi:hypothetical protein